MQWAGGPDRCLKEENKELKTPGGETKTSNPPKKNIATKTFKQTPHKDKAQGFQCLASSLSNTERMFLKGTEGAQRFHW